MPNDFAYTDAHIDVLLDLYFRDAPRATPFPMIADAMELPGHESGLDDLLWKVTTGYRGTKAHGPRREYVSGAARPCRARMAWWPREDSTLRNALAGEGQERDPPCDVAYIAAVLARPVKEVAAHWASLRADPLGRPGFGAREERQPQRQEA